MWKHSEGISKGGELAARTIARLKLSEMHEDIKARVEKREFISEKLPRFIVALAEYDSGFTEIRFDKPGNVHSHKDSEGRSSERKYEQDLMERIKELMGFSSFENYEFRDAAAKIIHNKQRIFRINREETTISNNAKQVYSLHAPYDVRDLPSRRGAEKTGGENWIPEDLTGYWVASASNGLQRDLYMRFSCRDGTARFHRDAIEEEMNYAIGRIREAAGI